MTVVVITPPDPIIDLDTAKSHLRVLHDDDDAIIETYISAAISWIDGPAGWLGRSLGMQTLQLQLQRFPGRCLIELPYGPLIDIVSVKYDDLDGAEQTIDPAGYTLDPGGVLPAAGASWPSARTRAGSVRVTYRAGYVRDPAISPSDQTVPDAIRAAMLLMIGHLYANRAAVNVGNIVNQFPFGVTALLAPFRVWSI